MRARGHLVEVGFIAFDEILDGQDTPITAIAHETLALGLHPPEHPGIDFSRYDAQIQNPVAVDVAPHGKTHDPLAVGHHHDAGLGIERHELLQDAGNRKQGQRPGDVGLRLQHPLSVAVVAQRAGFQHGGKPQPPHGFRAATLRRPRPRSRACAARGHGRSTSRAGGPANRRGACSPAGCCIFRTAESECLPARFRIHRSPHRCGGTAPRAPQHRRRPRRYDRRKP